MRSTWRSYLLRRSIPLRDDGDPEIYRVTGPKVYANNRKGRDSNLEVFPWGWGQKATADMPECQWPCVNYTHLFIFHLFNKYFLNTCWDLGQSTKGGFSLYSSCSPNANKSVLTLEVLSSNLSTFFPSFLLSFYPSIHPWLCSKRERRRLKGLCPWLWGQVELDLILLEY